MPTNSNQPGYLLEPKLYSAHQLIAESRRYFQIPEKQRQFSWDKDIINRLIEDIIRDMTLSMIRTTGNSRHKVDSHALSFLGTVVCCNETDEAYVVTDGQQRLTVFMILSITLHDYINDCISTSSESTKLKEQCKKISGELEVMFEFEQDRNSQARPCMIREFEDIWPAQGTPAKYKSPISHYISCYGEYRRERSQDEMPKFIDYYNEIVEDNPQMVHDLRYKQFGNAVNRIKDKIDGICKHDSNELRDIVKILAGSDNVKYDILDNLFKSNFPDFTLDSINFKKSEHQKIIRAFIISVYLMHKVRFVFLVATREDYASDVFKSLNTTGELLTAYETFRPEIIRVEGSEYRHTNSWKYIRDIDKYLANSTDQKLRKKMTDEMLISFALAESGRNLSKTVDVQRNYLKEKYQNINTSPKRDDFIRHMKHVADVYEYLWYGNKTIEDIFNINDVSIQYEIIHARFALDFIKATKHSISIALISRFYAEAQLARSNKKDKVLELCGAIKAIAAFFALWRSYRDSTDGIDGRYRRMFTETRPICFSRKDGISSSLPELTELKAEFCYLLKEEGGKTEKTIPSCEKWIARAQQFDIYRSNKEVAKFILLLSAHNSVEDSSKPGLLKKGLGNTHPILNFPNVWRDDKYKTIEHIIPKSAANNSGLDAETLNCLGNLTLLPKAANSIFSKRSWPEKKALFRIIGAKTPEEIDKRCREAIQLGIKQGSINKLRDKERFESLPMATTISKWQGNFASPTHINNRGENLMKMAWRTLSKWLDF